MGRLLLAGMAALLLLLLLGTGCMAEGQERKVREQQERGSTDDKLPAGEQLYLDAVRLRESGAVSVKEVRSMLVNASKAQFDEYGQGVEIPDEGAHAGALYELYLLYEHGSGVVRNRKLAAAFLNASCKLGWPDAQAEMGFRQAMGLHNVSTVSNREISHIGKADMPRALLNYYFAGRQNSSVANLVMGYRHSVGLGVPKSCATAVLYYNPVAEDVIRMGKDQSGFPQVDKLRLSHKTMSGLHRGREQEVLQYYQYSADLGNVEAQTAVGQLFNHGAQGIERDHLQALHYLTKAAEQDDPKAMSHLGHMYANGQGVEPSNETALMWFNKAAVKNHPSALYGLGYLYLSGYGVKQDLNKAFNYFTMASELSHAESQFHLGVMHLKGWGVKADRQRAFYYFNMASHAGHVLAQYNAAMMQLSSDPSASSCSKALAMLKQVAERGPVAVALQRARKNFLAGAHADALMDYLRAAEMGSELGMANAAFMLRQKLGASAKDGDYLAVQLYSRAADQMNVHALLQVADSYYYGRGVPVNWAYAAQLYEKASERSAQALFNLGYMHQFGAGLEQDLHLAKRYYDLAKSQDPEASIPVQVALFCMKIHGWLDTFLPLLPRGLADAVRSTLLTVRQPESTLTEHHMPTLGWLDSLMDYIDNQSPQGEGAGIKDSYDTALLLFLCIGLAVVLRRRRALRLQAAAGGGDMVDNMDPVGGVEDPNDREERLRREWADTVRRRQSAHHQQQQQQLLQPQAQDEAMRGRDAR